MTDKDKVIKALERCKRCECDDCTEKGASQAPWDCPAYDDFVNSAIAMLKEQEPMMVRLTTSTIRCPKCGKQITSRGAIHREIKFCWKCGQAVKWE